MTAELEFVKSAGGSWAAMVGRKRVGVIVDVYRPPDKYGWELLDPHAHWQGSTKSVPAAKSALVAAWKAVHAPPVQRSTVRVGSLLEADTAGLMVKGRTAWIVVRTIGESHRHGRRWVAINGVDFAPERMIETKRVPT